MFVFQKTFREELPDEKLFRHVLISTLVACFSDILYRISDGKNFSGAAVINAVSCAVFYVAMIFTCFIWLIYTECKLNKDYKKFYKLLPFYGIPFIVAAVFILLSPWKGYVFSIQSGIFVRGKLYWILAVCGWFYMLYSAVLAIYYSIKEKDRSKKRECLLIALFVSFPLIGSAMQAEFFGVPLSYPCVTVSEMLIFINLQNKQISLDSLTGVNNRGQLNKFLYSKCDDYKSEKILGVILADIDDFKKINDTFGHIVGDEALIKVASCLKQVCESDSGKLNFLARYGGDEFAIVLVRDSEQDIEYLIEKISYEIEKINQRENLDYILSISAGYAVLDRKENFDAEQLIASADKKLYLSKNIKKKSELSVTK